MTKNKNLITIKFLSKINNVFLPAGTVQIPTSFTSIDLQSLLEKLTGNPLDSVFFKIDGQTVQNSLENIISQKGLSQEIIWDIEVYQGSDSSVPQSSNLIPITSLSFNNSKKTRVSDRKEPSFLFGDFSGNIYQSSLNTFTELHKNAKESNAIPLVYTRSLEGLEAPFKVTVSEQKITDISTKLHLENLFSQESEEEESNPFLSFVSASYSGDILAGIVKPPGAPGDYSSQTKKIMTTESVPLKMGVCGETLMVLQKDGLLTNIDSERDFGESSFSESFSLGLRRKQHLDCSVFSEEGGLLFVSTNEKKVFGWNPVKNVKTAFSHEEESKVFSLGLDEENKRLGIGTVSKVKEIELKERNKVVWEERCPSFVVGSFEYGENKKCAVCLEGQVLMFDKRMAGVLKEVGLGGRVLGVEVEVDRMGAALYGNDLFYISF